MSDARTMGEAFVYRYRTGIAWREPPEVIGTWQTVPTWHQDSTIARAHQHATNTTRLRRGWIELHESSRRAA